MIQEILFYGIGIFLICLFYRIIKSQISGKESCSSCSGNCACYGYKK